MRHLLSASALAALIVAWFTAARAQSLPPEHKLLRDIYQELIEINTTSSSGDTTLTARAMAARLQTVGFSPSMLQLVVPPSAPKKGNLMARLSGSGRARPLLLLAHLDVVEAKAADWQHDPFKLLEKNGYFYARGAVDDKAMAAALVASMMRIKREGRTLARDLILALTADEEITSSKWNGVQYLLEHHRPLIDAELALNEGNDGTINHGGRYVYQDVQADEKLSQTFHLKVRNTDGHSSRPSKDNAIYHLAEGLARLGRFDFPFKLSPLTRSFFQRRAAIETGEQAQDMRGILRNPPDARALAHITKRPGLNSLVRTTCVATMLDAGHADNALPQRARAVVNCRLLPGESVSEVQHTLVRVLADPQISVVAENPPPQSTSPQLPPQLPPQLMHAVENVSAEIWPGVPIIPMLSPGATDGRLLSAAGIHTYGITGQFLDPDGSGVHGLDERLHVKSLYDSYEFLYRLIMTLAR